MSGNGILNQEIELSALPGNGKQVRDLVEKFCTEIGFPKLQIEGLQLAASEAFNNAVEHGLGFNNAEKVLLSFKASPSKLIIQIEDHGEGMNFKKLNHRGTAVNLGERGRGFQLINALIDGMELECLRPSGTRLTLVKWRSNGHTGCLTS